MVALAVRRLAGALALLALAAPVPALAARSPRIVGGSPAAAADLPYVAGLKIALQGVGDDEPDALCGGSLIAARWVLTAAHCLVEEPIDAEHSSAVLGAANLDAATPDQRYAFAETFVPAGYASGNGGSDVGLVRLDRPAAAQQLRLLRPSDAALLAPGTAALTAGWGYTEDVQDGGRLSTSQLRAVDLRVVADVDCQREFAEAGQGDALDFSTEVCAIAPGKDACNGDSGGPLVVTDGGGLPALAGSVSFGIGNGSLLRGSRSCNEGPPGVYSRLAAGSLNAFVRAHVPQVEVDADVAAPVPGQKVAFTARPSAPGASGPFGGYDALSWDLDGDGAFGERAGERSVRLELPAGATTVSVLASTDTGDAEVRTVRLATQAKSAVSVARRPPRAREGRSVRVRIARVGVGGGSVVAALGRARRTVTFRGDERARTVRFPRRGDRRPERSRRLELTLSDFAGDVVAGRRTSTRLTVADDDLRVRSVRVRGGRVRLRVRSGPGRLRASGAAAGARIVRGFATHTLSARVRGSGRVTVAFKPKGLRRPSRRHLTL